MDTSIIGFIIFIATFVAGRLINERALKILGDEERGKLVRGFSKYRIVNLISLVMLVIIYYATRYASPDSLFADLQVFFGVLVAYLLGSSVYAYFKLKRLEVSDKYINQFLLSTLIQYVGLFVFFGLVIGKN